MTKKIKDLWLNADWPAPDHVRAGTSIRIGGYSKSPYDKSNVSLSVGDDPKHVKKNRAALSCYLGLDGEPIWLEQTHSEKILSVNNIPTNLKADGSYTTKQNRICVVTTADCVPILFCNNEGTKVAAIHAGWKGICRGIIENAVKIFSCPESTIVWIGPCISNEYYEIGENVYSNLLDYSNLLKSAFKKNDKKNWYCSLSDIAKILLKNSGINKIHECGLCTYKMDSLFFSYRRDGDTGRTASMIWIDSSY